MQYMVPEILFIRGLWKENRRLWWVSFPFHFGLYLMIATFGLLRCPRPSHPVGAMIPPPRRHHQIPAGRPHRCHGVDRSDPGNHRQPGASLPRWTDPELRNYSSFADYFNILFILLFFLFALVTALFADPLLEGAKAYVFGLLTGEASPERLCPGSKRLRRGGHRSASLLVAYIPLTHMSHMFMKYFLYHKVKWDDAPNRRGGRIEAAIRKNLELKPTWKAKHVEADGQKSWLDIASSAPKEMK